MNDLDLLKRIDPVDTLVVEALVERPVFDDLFNEVVGERSTPDAPFPATRGLSSTGWSISKRRWLGSVAALAIVGSLITVGVVRLTASTRVSTVPVAHLNETTAWEPARRLPPAGHFGPRPAGGSWQLVSAIVHTGWLLNTSGPGSGFLACPTQRTCYVFGLTPESDTHSGHTPYDDLYVSGDAGQTWSVLPMPTGVDATLARPSCWAELACAVGGTVGRTSVLASTVDGGHQWRITPTGLSGDLVQLKCSSGKTCHGVSAPSYVAFSLIPPPQPANESFVTTTDGGKSWTTSPLPPTDWVSAMACTTTEDCVMVGYPKSASRPLGFSTPGFALWTRDGGATWASGQLPQGLEFAALNVEVSCSNATSCMATSQVPGGAQSAVVTTADGGETWQMRPLPSSVPKPQLSSVSCASPTECWVAGEQAVSQTIGSVGVDGGSAVLLGTVDGGATWNTVTFTIPPGAPEDVGSDAYMSIGQISCPSVDECVGLGMVDVSSTFTPVYNYFSTPASSSS